MTAPVWMAVPPEVHSALLSSGPGPGPLAAAAGAWNSLSAEYSSAAQELGAVVAAVQAGAWQGSGADSYGAAHAPYLAWLMQASVDSAAAAAQLDTAAAAYASALAAMPTLAELAANHAVHAALVATNFFGINTIPIALNEADYVRMWVQAATTMAAYQAVSGTAVASTPQTTPAPQIQKAAGSTAAQTDAQALAAQPVSFDTVLAYLQQLGISNQTAYAFGIDNIYDFLTNPVGYTETHLISRLLTDPLSLLVNPLYVFFDGDEVFFPLGYAFLPSTAGALALAPAASAGAFVGLAGVATAEPALGPVPAPASAPAPTAPGMLPAAGMGSTVPVPGAAPATSPAPPPAPAPAPAGAAPAPPPAAGGGFFPPYAVGPPGIGFGSGMSTGAHSSAKRKAPEPDAAAVAAAAAARHETRTRRRRRVKLRDHGDEFADMDVTVDPVGGAPSGAGPQVSGNGAGPLGVVGTARNPAGEQAAGLATLVCDKFGGGPTMPMVPGSWSAERPADSNGSRHQHN
ncbi:PPE family protein [Mycobacterium sp.]|uniref:PPE family protein n=1 Tax=Mycobacterium sp. TaxID=1785 RepID=UPI0031E484A4